MSVVRAWIGLISVRPVGGGGAGMGEYVKERVCRPQDAAEGGAPLSSETGAVNQALIRLLQEKHRGPHTTNKSRTGHCQSPA
ncbi:hypothetical protein SRHO_G00133740 [Serrasalmus rhombeus]